MCRDEREAHAIAKRDQLCDAGIAGWIARAKGARSALLGLFEAISAIQAVGLGLRNMPRPSPIVDEAMSIVRAAIVDRRPEKWLGDLDALTHRTLDEGILSIEEAYVLDRCKFMVAVFRDIRDGLLSNRVGRLPRRIVNASRPSRLCRGNYQRAARGPRCGHYRTACSALRIAQRSAAGRRACRFRLSRIRHARSACDG